MLIKQIMEVFDVLDSSASLEQKERCLAEKLPPSVSWAALAVSGPVRR